MGIKNWLGQARRRLGLVSIQGYAPSGDAPWLRQIVGLLTEPSWRGDSYRQLARRWLYSRRAIKKAYSGIMFHAEIDDPRVGYGSPWPIGGRIYSSDDSCWIELSPQQAHMIEKLLENTINNTLQTWLKNNGMEKQHHDETHVRIENRAWSPAKLMDDRDFADNEARIATEAFKETRTLKEKTDYPDNTVYFDGFHGYPSKCLCIPFMTGDKAHIVLCHFYKYGGTSPTNMFEELASMLRTTYFPEISPSEIEWHDYWPEHNSLDNHERFHHVQLDWDIKARCYGNPVWSAEPDISTRLVDEVHRVIALAKKHYKAHGGELPKRNVLPTKLLPSSIEKQFRLDLSYNEENIYGSFEISDLLFFYINSYQDLKSFIHQFEVICNDGDKYTTLDCLILRQNNTVRIESGSLRALMTWEEYQAMKTFFEKSMTREDVVSAMTVVRAFYE